MAYAKTLQRPDIGAFDPSQEIRKFRSKKEKNGRKKNRRFASKHPQSLRLSNG